MTIARGYCATLLGALAATLAAATARAQSVLHLDIGSGAASFDNVPGSTIVVFSPAFSHLARPFSVNAGGVWTSFDRGGWTGQGTLAAAWTPQLGRYLVPELAARFDASVRAAGLRSGQALGQLRLHIYPSPGASLWLGAAAGEAWHGFRSQPVARAEAGLLASLGRARFSFSFVSARVVDSVPRVAWLQGLTQNEINTARLDTLTARPDTLFATRSTGYREAATGVEWSTGRLELGGSFARRFGAAGLPDVSSWSASALVWLTTRFGLVVGGGRYPSDPAQAHPGGKYATLSLRFALQPEASRVRSRIAALTRIARASAGASRFELTALPGSRYVVRVRAPEARTVEIMGDFSDWRPVTLTAADDGSWIAVLELTSGIYRLNLRVDGGVWEVPPGLAAQPDEFGGMAGVLIIGR
ncbi:MAG TPA: glycogen-binding domain-containing protein [Gemmatimonadales bacterium]|nr:glycogen-binding domain-containing protein [Gemmatimonadales bacterium]